MCDQLGTQGHQLAVNTGLHFLVSLVRSLAAEEIPESHTVIKFLINISGNIRRRFIDQPFGKPLGIRLHIVHGIQHALNRCVSRIIKDIIPQKFDHGRADLDVTITGNIGLGQKSGKLSSQSTGRRREISLTIGLDRGPADLSGLETGSQRPKFSVRIAGDLGIHLGPVKGLPHCVGVTDLRNPNLHKSLGPDRLLGISFHFTLDSVLELIGDRFLNLGFNIIQKPVHPILGLHLTEINPRLKRPRESGNDRISRLGHLALVLLSMRKRRQ